MIDIKVMRKVDFWIGVPVCCVLTLLYKISKALGFRRVKGEPQNILFIELGEMGSSIISYPAMREARKMFPRAKLYFLIFHEIKSTVELLDLLPKEGILTIRSKSFLSLAWDTLKFPCVARKHKIDTIVDLEFFSRYSAILTFLSGACRTVGFHRFNMEGMYRGDMYTHRVQFNPYVHTAQAYASLVRALRAPLNQVPMVKEPIDDVDVDLPKIKLTPERKEHIWNKLKSFNKNISERSRIVLLNPNSSFLITLRRWPLHNYALLAKRLLEQKEVYIVVTGVKSERDNAVYILEFVKSDRCLNLAGETTLQELIELYNISDVLVTNDSGPAQFAALTNIKILDFFGPETPVRFRPLSRNSEVLYSNFACSPCVSPFNQLDSPCRDNKCLQVINVDTVYRKVIESLK